MKKTAAWMRAMGLGGWLMFIALGNTGCQQPEVHGLEARPVTIDEFAKPGSASSTASASSTPSTQKPAGAPTTESAVEPATSQVPSRETRALKPGDQIYVESVIGQVSGRPIFADALLEPIADQLRRESEQSNRAEFAMKAKGIVESRLREMVQSELFLAESEAALTEQQQQGLIAMLGQMREKTIAESFGSLSQREKELQETEGMTLDRYMQLRKNQVLTQSLLYERISPRVIVSWRDVEREYERHKADFNPPAMVTLKRITLSNASQRELIEQLKSRLSAGESFDSATAALNLAADVRPLEPLKAATGDLADVEILDAYKPHLKGLKVGQTTAAIEITTPPRNDTTWLHVVQIDQPPAQTIYDVQRELYAALEKRRKDEQLDHYLRSLMEKGNYDQLEEMARRVLMVALLRYGR